VSAVTETPVGVLCTDPAGGVIGTRIIRRLTSVSHEHHGSFKPATLEDLTGPDTRLVVSRTARRKDWPTRASRLLTGSGPSSQAS
jgi:hypothetical protein